MFRRIQRMKISTRVICLMALVLAVAVSANYVYFLRGYSESVQEGLLEKAVAFTQVAEEAKNYGANLHEEGSYDVEGLLEELEADSKGDFRDSRFFRTIPVMVGWRSAANAAEEEGIDFQVTALEARNPTLEPHEGSFRHELITKLTSEYQRDGTATVSEINEQTNALHVMRAIQLRDSCMMCHGQPGNQWDTDGDGTDVLGYPMEGWATGDMHGAWEVILPLGGVDQQLASFIQSGLLLTSVIGALGVGAFLLGLRRFLGTPLRHFSRNLEFAGQGDLTSRMPNDLPADMGQIATCFNRSFDSVESGLSNVRAGAREIDLGASQISNASQQLSSAATEQAASLQEISSSLEQISSMSEQNSDNSKMANNLAQEARNSAEKGEKNMGAMLQAMKDIRSSSEEISRVIKVIDDIAFQTNLLALNAAVEAARAGESGKSFAVVAEEVRDLAQRCAEAARNTAEMISRSSERAEKGASLSTSVSENLEDIVEQVEKVNNLASEISAASAEQANGINHITRGVRQLDEVVQLTASSSEELAANAEETSGQVAGIRRLVEAFKVRERRQCGNRTEMPALDLTSDPSLTPVEPMAEPPMAPSEVQEPSFDQEIRLVRANSHRS